MTKTRSELRFIFYSAAIFVCYFVFGMLQEKITRGKYGNNDKFTCALSLVLVQCVVNYIFAQILMVSINKDHFFLYNLTLYRITWSLLVSEKC